MREPESNKEWKKWGEVDPLFGVASWHGKQKEGSNPWTDEEFYKLGECDWQDFLRHWEKYGVNNESCLEIGCGAGRITRQLSAYFKEVHALDISEDMIEYAKKNITSASVTFHLSNGFNIPLASQSIASVFSTHVFQHFESLSVASTYFAEISRVIKPNGTFMIHLPIYKWPTMSRYFSLLYAVIGKIEYIRALARRRLMDLGIVRPIMRETLYKVDFLYDKLPTFGFDDIEISIFVTKSNNYPHPFVFARKKASQVS